MITSAQCRAARAILRWTQTTLAERAIVGRKTIVEFENGQRPIRVRTAADICTTFEMAGVRFDHERQCVLLAAEASPEAAAPPPPPAPSFITHRIATQAEVPPAQPKTVLLVDDDPTFREAAETYLIRSGFHVLAKSHPAQAQALIFSRGETLDCAVIDINLPRAVHQGIALANLLRRNFPRLQPIIISAFPLSAGVAGNRKVLTKPIDPERIAKEIHVSLAADASARRATDPVSK